MKPIKPTLKHMKALNSTDAWHPKRSHSRTSNKKSVSFSKFGKCKVFQKAAFEKGMKSYRKSDYEGFKIIRDYDVIRCSGIVAIKLAMGENLTIEEKCLCTGLEHVLSPDVPKRVDAIEEARELHVKKVLDEQTRQEGSGGFSADLMAYVSMKSSKNSRAFAHRVAANACNA